MGEKGQGAQLTSYSRHRRTPSWSSRTFGAGRRSPAPKSPPTDRGQTSTGSDERRWHHATQKSSEKKGQGGPGQGGPPAGRGARAAPCKRPRKPCKRPCVWCDCANKYVLCWHHTPTTLVSPTLLSSTRVCVPCLAETLLALDVYKCQNLYLGI